MPERKVKKTDSKEKKTEMKKKNMVKKSDTVKKTIPKKKTSDKKNKKSGIELKNMRKSIMINKISKKKMVSDDKKKKHPKPNMKKFVSPSTAARSPVGSFHHPTKETFRTGACPVGYIYREPYQRKSYMKKDGTKVKAKNIRGSCIEDKGKPGRTFKKDAPIHLKRNDDLKKFGYSTKLSSSKRMDALIKACKTYTYKSVALKISALHTLQKNTNPKVAKIFADDLKHLQEWRKKHPNLYKNKNQL